MKKTSHPLLIFCIAITILIASVIVISWLLETQKFSAPMRLALALVPVSAWTVCLVLELRFIRQCDELQRRILLETLAIAFPSLAVAIIACEYLRKAGFITALKPDYVLLMMVILLFIGYLIARRRYR